MEDISMAKDDKQMKLFDSPEWWEEHWQGMPEFVQDDLSPFRTIMLHFKDREDMELFEKLVDQKIYRETKSIWYPKVKIERYINKQYIDES